MKNSLEHQMQRHFDGIARAYYDIVDNVWYDYGYFHCKELQFLRDHVEPELRLVVDAGCGPGRHSAALSGLAQRVVAVDISRNMLMQVRTQRQTSLSGSTPDLVQADVRLLPFKEGLVDCVVNFEVLERLPGGEEAVLAALRSFRRVLRNHGTLITEAPLFFHKLVDYLGPPSMREITKETRQRYYEDAPLAVGNVFRENRVEELLLVAGFSIALRTFVRVLPSGLIERFPELVRLDELMEKVPLVRKASREVIWLAQAV